MVGRNPSPFSNWKVRQRTNRSDGITWTQSSFNSPAVDSWRSGSMAEDGWDLSWGTLRRDGPECGEPQCPAFGLAICRNFDRLLIGRARTRLKFMIVATEVDG